MLWKCWTVCRTRFSTAYLAMLVCAAAAGAAFDKNLSGDACSAAFRRCGTLDLVQPSLASLYHIARVLPKQINAVKTPTRNASVFTSCSPLQPRAEKTDCRCNGHKAWGTGEEGRNVGRAHDVRV